tara:strand:+ start:48 stop:467 length:420 start_codon:yes stop_codon:yes gene_type:complete
MAFKMKNPSLAKAMKEGSPMQLNYSSPTKHVHKSGRPLTEQEKKDFARKEQERLKREKTIKKVKDVAKEALKRRLDPLGVIEKIEDYSKSKQEEREKQKKKQQERIDFERKRKNDPQYKYRVEEEGGGQRAKGKYGAQG